MELKGSKTEQNLMAAFAGESQARNKYTYFASKAKKDGYEQIAALFEETANNEKEHAKIWFKLLEGGSIKSTPENLKGTQPLTTPCLQTSSTNLPLKMFLLQQAHRPAQTNVPLSPLTSSTKAKAQPSP